MNLDDLVGRAKSGDQRAYDALLNQFAPLLNREAGRYRVPGMEKADVLQELRLSLADAVHDFKPNTSRGFHPFLCLCVRRRVITLLKTALREKRRPFNMALALDEPALREGRDTLGEMLAGNAPDPCKVLVEADSNAERLEEFLFCLSPFERAVVLRFGDGATYREIAAALGCSFSSVDNTMQRVRRKARYGYTRNNPALWRSVETISCTD